MQPETRVFCQWRLSLMIALITSPGRKGNAKRKKDPFSSRASFIDSLKYIALEHVLKNEENIQGD